MVRVRCDYVIFLKRTYSERMVRAFYITRVCVRIELCECFCKKGHRTLYTPSLFIGGLSL